MRSFIDRVPSFVREEVREGLLGTTEMIQVNPSWKKTDQCSWKMISGSEDVWWSLLVSWQSGGLKPPTGESLKSARYQMFYSLSGRWRRRTIDHRHVSGQRQQHSS